MVVGILRSKVFKISFVNFFKTKKNCEVLQTTFVIITTNLKKFKNLPRKKIKYVPLNVPSLTDCTCVK